MEDPNLGNLEQSFQNTVQAINDLSVSLAALVADLIAGTLVVQSAPQKVAGSPASGQVSVGTSATSISAAGTYSFRSIENTSAVVVFLGPSGVTITTGFALNPGCVFATGESVPQGSLYGVVAAGTATVGVLTW